MGKGEIARYEQFLLFLQCFQKACFPGALKGVIVWEWVKKGAQIIVSLRSLKIRLNKRTTMVLYRSPEYLAVQVNKDKYQTDY